MQKHTQFCSWNIFVLLAIPSILLLVMLATAVVINIFAALAAFLIGVGLIIMAPKDKLEPFVKKVPIQYEGVLTFLGARRKYIFLEGYHLVIPFISDIELVDMRERVFLVPGVDDPNPFQITAGVSTDSPVELKVRAILRWTVKDSYLYLSADPTAVEKAMINEAIDAIRNVAASTPDKDFISKKDIIAKNILKDVLGEMYQTFLGNMGLNIPKAEYADEQTSRAKQLRAEEAAKTIAQFEEVAGTKGTAERIEAVAVILKKAGMEEKEAAHKAFQLVQTGENRETVTTIQTNNALTDLFAMISAAVTQARKNTP